MAKRVKVVRDDDSEFVFEKEQREDRFYPEPAGRSKSVRECSEQVKTDAQDLRRKLNDAGLI